MTGLPISAVAEQTGLAAGTIRMWEQRYGFPVPERTPAGYRVYSDDDLAALQLVVELRRGGLSVPAALERARSARKSTSEQPTIFGAVPHGGKTRRLRKRTLIALSRAIEDQTIASAARPVVLGAFQHERHYRAVQHRYRRMAKSADFAAVFADFEEAAEMTPGEPAEVPIAPDAPMCHEWAVVVDAPGFSVCLSAWEPPVATEPESELDRVFEAFWTLDADTVRIASRAGAECARAYEPEVAERIDALLENRQHGPDATNGALEALTVRMVDYLESA